MLAPWALTGERNIPVQHIPPRLASGYTDSQRVWLDEHLTAVGTRCT